MLMITAVRASWLRREHVWDRFILDVSIHAHILCHCTLYTPSFLGVEFDKRWEKLGGLKTSMSKDRLQLHPIQWDWGLALDYALHKGSQPLVW